MQACLRKEDGTVKIRFSITVEVTEKSLVAVILVVAKAILSALK
jgi:hypothetical protein